MTTATNRYCATHPDVETGLRCSRCEVAICPRCLVQTPVGARCRPCARLRRPPMYELSPLVLAKAIGVAVALGGVLGGVGGLLLPRGLGMFGFFAVFVGPPVGYFFAEVLSRVTRSKRGPVMQAVAVGGLVLAYVVSAFVRGGVRLEALQGDIFGMVLIAAACAGAVTRLR